MTDWLVDPETDTEVPDFLIRYETYYQDFETFCVCQGLNLTLEHENGSGGQPDLRLRGVENQTIRILSNMTSADVYTPKSESIVLRLRKISKGLAMIAEAARLIEFFENGMLYVIAVHRFTVFLRCNTTWIESYQRSLGCSDGSTEFFRYSSHKGMHEVCHEPKLSILKNRYGN